MIDWNDPMQVMVYVIICMLAFLIGWLIAS